MAQLTIRRHQDGQSVKYSYDLRSSGGENSGPLEQEYAVTANPALIKDLCGAIDDVVCRAQEGEDTGGKLANTGQVLYKTLFPSKHVNISDLARRLHGEESLLVCSSESQIPWELLHNGDDFLCLRHDLGRKTFVTRNVVSGRAVGRLQRALIVGDPLGDLGAAREEAGNIAAWLGARGTECTSLVGREASLIGLIQALSEGEYDLFHYSGHVDTPHGSTLTGLRLFDDELLDENALQPLSDKGVPPIVFINGCASAGQLNNLCVAFMIAGAKVVIGTRYEVPEPASRQFAERFYAAMLEGKTAGGAVRAARQSVVAAGGVSWASFVLYGDPSVLITSPRPGEAEDAEDPGGAIGDVTETGLDSQASALMQRVERQSAGHGIATSLDLLTELIPTREFRRRVTGTAGSTSLSVLQHLLSTVQDITPPAPPETDQPIELSGTVQSVLDRATRRVQESGRGLVTIDDLVDAFFAVGGGHSREILELLGIPMPGGADPGTSRTPPGGSRVTGPEVPADANGHSDSPHGRPFGVDGRLHRDCLTPAAGSALLVAALLAAAQGSVVSTSMLVAAFAVTGSGALRGALAEQGAAGEAAFTELAWPVRVSQRNFSSRTLRALRRAAEGAAAEPLGDAAILRELLTEEDSTAREMLARLHLDPAQVLRWLTPPDPG